MQGLLLRAIVHSAGVQDRDGGIWLLATLFGQFPFLAKLFADSAYAGSIFHTALGKVLPNLKTEIVRRSDRAEGFVPLPKRWIVETYDRLAEPLPPTGQGLGKSHRPDDRPVGTHALRTASASPGQEADADHDGRGRLAEGLGLAGAWLYPTATEPSASTPSASLVIPPGKKPRPWILGAGMGLACGCCANAPTGPKKIEATDTTARFNDIWPSLVERALSPRTEDEPTGRLGGGTTPTRFSGLASGAAMRLGALHPFQCHTVPQCQHDRQTSTSSHTARAATRVAAECARCHRREDRRHHRNQRCDGACEGNERRELMSGSRFIYQIEPMTLGNMRANGVRRLGTCGGPINGE